MAAWDGRSVNKTNKMAKKCQAHIYSEDVIKKHSKEKKAVKGAEATPEALSSFGFREHAR